LDFDFFTFEENFSDPFKTVDSLRSDACRNNVTVLADKFLQFQELAINNV
jgi:hypothetical protein